MLHICICVYIWVYTYTHKEKKTDLRMVSGKIDERVKKFVTFTVFVQLLVRRRELDSRALYVPCSKGWIGFGRKCFYFSDETRNWTFSQIFCTSEEAVLAQFGTEEELVRNIFGSCSLLSI